MKDIEYVLTMNSDQAHTALKATDLLMRLKLGQYKEIPFALLDVTKEDFCHRRDLADVKLKEAFDILYDGKNDGEWKDAEWYRLYNLLQAIRYQIHLAEHPNSKGVDSYSPMRLTDEPMPSCRVKRPVYVLDIDGQKVCPQCRYILDGKKTRPFCEMCGTELMWEKKQERRRK